MVARLTLGKKKFRDVSDEMSSILDSAEKLRATLTARIDEDAAAFDGVMAARGLPRNSEAEQAERLQAINIANLHATEVPLQTMRDGVSALECARRAAASGNPNSVTDAGVGALMAAAAVEGAWLNVLVNLSGLADEATAKRLQGEGEKILADARRRQQEVMTLVHEKIDG
jgi:glutamate formiminotransferase/formiminotetrahydrofolate cyclodeaminase